MRISDWSSDVCSSDLCLQRIVREAAEYHHAPCPRRILDELPKRLWRHRQAGKGNQLRGLAAPCPGVRRRALNDLVKVDRAGRAGWQIGRGHTLHVLHAALAHRDCLVPERIAAVLDLVDEGLCVCLQIRRSEEHTSELQSL